MKKVNYTVFIALTIALLLSVTFISASETKNDSVTELFVALNGNDSNTGSIDAPFFTIEKARDTIREMKNAGKLPDGGITVYLREGTYKLTSGIFFSALDSGTEASPITYTAYKDENVIFDGAVTLSAKDFKPVSADIAKLFKTNEAKSSVLQIDLKAAGINDFGLIEPTGQTSERGISPHSPELFIGGERATLAQYPNEGFLKIGDVSATSDGAVTFVYSDKTLEGWASYDDIWVFGYFCYDWADSTSRLQSFKPDEKTLTLANTHAFGFQNDCRYYFFNVLDEIDMPGEWYLDRKTGILYVYPTEDFNSAKISFSQITQNVITASDTDFLTFKNLTVEGSRDGGIVISGDNNTVDGCYLSKLTNKAISLTGNNNAAINNEICYVGSYGIVLSGGDRVTLTPCKSYAENNYIHHWSQLVKTYQSGIQADGVGIRISHNELYYAPHQAIGYSGNDILIEYNEIHEVCRESGDAGVTYAGRDWTWQNCVVRYNYIHDIYAGDLGGSNFAPNGIYFDDTISGQTAYGNILENIAGNGMLIGGGRDNNIENNVLINVNGSPIAYDDRGRTWDSYKDRSTTVWTRLAEIPYTEKLWSFRFPKLSLIKTDSKLSEDIDYPVNPSNNNVRNNITFKCVKKDIGSIEASVIKYSTVRDNKIYGDVNPGFIDIGNRNYGFTEDARVFFELRDFENIPFDKIGRFK